MTNYPAGLRICQASSGSAVVTTQQPEQRRGHLSAQASGATVQAAPLVPSPPSELDNKVVRAASARDSSEVGAYLARFPWEWFVTLTFKNRVGEATADRALWAFIRECRIRQGFMPGFFCVTEWQERRHVPHFHLLMLDVSGLRRLDLKDWWERYGFARVEPYDPMRGANNYVGKYLFKDCGKVQASRNLSKWLYDPCAPAGRVLERVFDLAGQQSEKPSRNTADKLVMPPVSDTTGAPGK